jgi:hypothetical protein
MKKLVWICTFCILVCQAFCQEAPKVGPEPELLPEKPVEIIWPDEKQPGTWEPGFTVDFEFRQRYLDKGKVVNSDSNLLGRLGLSIGGFRFGFWVTQDMTDFHQEYPKSYDRRDASFGDFQDPHDPTGGKIRTSDGSLVALADIEVTFGCGNYEVPGIPFQPLQKNVLYDVVNIESWNLMYPQNDNLTFDTTGWKAGYDDTGDFLLIDGNKYYSDDFIATNEHETIRQCYASPAPVGAGGQAPAKQGATRGRQDVPARGTRYDAQQQAAMDARHKGVDKNDVEEVRYEFGYGYTFNEIAYINSLTVDLNFIYYDYPSRSLYDSQRELALTLSTGPFPMSYLDLRPGFTVAWDYKNERFWASVFVSHIEKFPKISDRLRWTNKFELFWANTSYNAWDNNVKKNALNALVWTMSLDYYVVRWFSFGPYAQAGFALDHDIREHWKHDDTKRTPGCNDRINLMAGLRMSFHF